jgi:hypothetical protein
MEILNLIIGKTQKLPLLKVLKSFLPLLLGMSAILKKGYRILFAFWVVAAVCLLMSGYKNMKASLRYSPRLEKVVEIYLDPSAKIVYNMRKNSWIKPTHRLESKNETEHRIIYNKKLMDILYRDSSNDTEEYTKIQENLINNLRRYHGYPKYPDGSYVLNNDDHGSPSFVTSVETDIDVKDHIGTEDNLNNKNKKDISSLSLQSKMKSITSTNEEFVTKAVLPSNYLSKSMLAKDKKKRVSPHIPIPIPVPITVDELNTQTQTQTHAHAQIQTQLQTHTQTPISSKSKQKIETKQIVVESNLKLNHPKPRPSGPSIILSLNRPVTSDVKGNLGAPNVITNNKIENWLTDRWQAASDMGGTPIPGKHYLTINLQRLCKIENIDLDWEDAYSRHWMFYGRRTLNDECVDKGKSKSNIGNIGNTNDEGWIPLIRSEDSRMTSQTKKHLLVHAIVPDQTKGNGDENDCTAPYYDQVKLVIMKPSTRFGSSLWTVKVNGKEFS